MNLKDFSTGFQHLGIPTNNMDATKEYYQKIGFEVIEEKDVDGLLIVFLQLGTLVIEAYQTNEAVMKAGAIDHVSIDVNDVDAVYAWINEMGLNNTNDFIHCIPVFENGFRFFKIEGPNKEILEFGQIL